MTAQNIATAFQGKTLTIDGKTFTAKIENTTDVVFEAENDTKFADKLTNVAKTGDKAKITPQAGTLAKGKGGTASSVTLDFDGRSGGDFLNGSVKIGDKTYAFVEDAAKKPADADVAIVIKKDSTSEQVAEAVKNAVTGYDVELDGTMKVKITEKAAVADTPAYKGKEIGVEFKGTGLRLQVGDTDDDFQKVRVAVGDMSTKGLGLDTLKAKGIADQTTAGTSIDKIKAAINTVSSTRGDLGAIQNRLEHTINNLGVTTENMTAAESRIRDTDMAQEMMSYTKNNILVQAAQAMLAQANQVPQGVLQLLQ